MTHTLPHLSSVVFLALLSCNRMPDRFEDCHSLRQAQQREECRYQLAKPMTREPETLQAALDSIEDPGSRDLLLLRLAIAEPRKAGQLCRLVKTEGAIEKCRQVLGRPHLQTSPRNPVESSP